MRSTIQPVPKAASALNQSPAKASAPPFARVLGEMFGGDSRAASLVLPTRPLHQMYAEPARAYIESHAGSVRTGATAKARLDGDGIVTIESDGNRWTAAAGKWS